jgi:hypothetical protein
VDAAQPPPAKRIVSAEAMAAITAGATREDVLSRLGEPSSRYAISDDQGIRESFTYDLSNGVAVVIRLVGGKVTQVP